MLGKLFGFFIVGLGVLVSGGFLLAQTLPEWAPYREGVPAAGVDLTPPIVALLGAQFSALLGFIAVIIGLVLIGVTIRAALRHRIERYSHR